MWSDLCKKYYQDLEGFGGMYIGGGNTYSLLQAIRETKFDVVIQKFLKSNRPIFGGSAGAIIFGKTIATCGDKNNIGLVNTDGLNVVSDYNLWCHYNISQDENIKSFVQIKDIPVIGLSERSGLLVTDGSNKVVGYQPVQAFLSSGKFEYSVGSTI